jgi:hypothetical protein
MLESSNSGPQPTAKVRPPAVDFGDGYDGAMRGPSRFETALSVVACIMVTAPLKGEPVPVRQIEGLIRGFLVLREMDDTLLATGDLSQVATATRVTNELVFQFKDGSLHQESYVFSQRRTFQLISYHLVQKGPSFKHPLDMSVDAASGLVTIHYTDDGKEKISSDKMKLPLDVANGLVTTLLNHIDPAAPKTTVSMVAPTFKPRLVKVEISSAGEDTFSIGGSSRKATRFVLHVNIGGISGVVAPIVGKQPPDTSVWMIEGKAPGFLKAEGPLFEGGPIWRIETASPIWPKGEPARKP